MSANYLSPFTSPKKQKPIINFKYPVPSLNSDKNCLNTAVFRQKSPQHKTSKNQTDFLNINKQYFLSEKQLEIKKHQGLQPFSMKNVQPNQDLTKAIYRKISFDQSPKMNKQVKIQKLQKQNTPPTVHKNQQTCQLCTKRKASYLIKQTQKYCCSNCALQQMKDGNEVAQLQQVQKTNKNLQQKIPKTKTNQQRKQELQFLNEEISNQKQKLQTKHQDLYFKNQQAIRQFFHSKKHVIRLHYQKLRQTIAISIQKDLEELREKQNKILKDFAQIQKQIQDNTIFLTQIQENLENHKIESLLNSEQVGKYDQVYAENSNKFKKLVSQLSNGLLSKIEALKQKGEGLNISMEQVQKKSQQLYEPIRYMLLKQKQIKKNPLRDPLFSFRC